MLGMRGISFGSDVRLLVEVVQYTQVMWNSIAKDGFGRNGAGSPTFLIKLGRCSLGPQSSIKFKKLHIIYRFRVYPLLETVAALLRTNTFFSGSRQEKNS